MLGLIIIVAIATLIVGTLLVTYNRLVARQQSYTTAFAQIEVQLKRRFDLIPNLVETARAYMAHEAATLKAVVEARNDARAALDRAAEQPASPEAMDMLKIAEHALNHAMSRLSVSVEAYPELKASENMQQLSAELTQTEDHVAHARQAFNDAVQQYNTLRQSFPAILVAPMLGHRADAALLEFADSVQIQQAPTVSF